MSVAAAWPRLIAITDASLLPIETLLTRLGKLAQAAQPGTVALLLRDHTLGARERLRFGQALQAVARAHGQALWVADRLDLAKLLEADAVHLGEGSVTARDARRLLGPGCRISRAWHAGRLEGVEAAAELDAVDALLVSPVLAARKGRPALGLSPFKVLGEQLRARNLACQMYALGGVSSENAAACLDAGATGVAAIGATLGQYAEPLLGVLGTSR